MAVVIALTIIAYTIGSRPMSTLETAKAIAGCYAAGMHPVYIQRQPRGYVTPYTVAIQCAPEKDQTQATERAK